MMPAKLNKIKFLIKSKRKIRKLESYT
jgi:hypothetical protein